MFKSNSDSEDLSYDEETEVEDEVVVKHRIPENFVAHHRIRSRNHDDDVQLNARDILNALPQYHTANNFCILAITMRDLYPRDSWNFIEGMHDD